ncbi:hypothetical protein IFM89_008723 [Coptis chinensis]|uniref:K+ potassium transporter integral membrane domain-containing protein n=1 Tax=Coptis chinensis TaxID=261450 RepID=A0A835GWV8_9MAGN|nr:hypothetical protein IFM89_008723 [Coptis chinensis]
MTTLSLAYQSFGVVVGDLSISPIYVFTSTFSRRTRLQDNDDEILGLLSLVFWTLTLIPLCKYIIVVLGAVNNGEGGIFALYSLLCRDSQMGLLNSSGAAKDNLSAYNSENSMKEARTSLLVKQHFRNHRSSRILLLLAVLLGTSMLISDGILAPSISVLSATDIIWNR